MDGMNASALCGLSDEGVHYNAVVLRISQRVGNALLEIDISKGAQ